MKFSVRLALLGLAFALLVFFAIVFRNYLFENFVRPVAILLWVFWQILQSFDQRVVWGLFIFLAVALAVHRLGHVAPSATEQNTWSDSNAILVRARFWQTSIMCTTDEIEKPNILKRDLEQLLVAVYAVRQPGTSRLEINKALRLRQIPLPETVYTFLFPADRTDSKRSIRKILQSIWQAPERWARHRTGRDVAEYYSAIDDVLIQIEDTLEITHDAH